MCLCVVRVSFRVSFVCVFGWSRIPSECLDMCTFNRPWSWSAQRKSQDPKDGEQCVNMGKSEETLVEGRSDTVCVSNLSCVFLIVCVCL